MLQTAREAEPLGLSTAARGDADEDLSVRLPSAEALRLVAMANHPSYGARVR